MLNSIILKALKLIYPLIISQEYLFQVALIIATASKHLQYVTKGYGLRISMLIGL